MGRMNFDEKSKLRTKAIKKVFIDLKDCSVQDFKFKVVEGGDKYWKRKFIEVYNFDTLILKMYIWGDGMKIGKGFEVNYFNPQTNNDCQSINHIIGVFHEECEEQHSDKGNADVINNEYVFRRKKNFYSFTLVWGRGDIKENNFNPDLSYAFATEEYINYLKRVYQFKRMPRRNLKKKIKALIHSAVSHEQKRKLVEAIGT